jgi:RNA polymerase sigma factor (sigma-70 family)
MKFEQFIKEFTPKLKRLINKININPAFISKDDLYQEVIIHLFNQYNKGTLEGNESYLLTKCFFFLKNYMRRPSWNYYFTKYDEELGIDEKDIASNIEASLSVEEILNLCSDKEKEILKLLMQGYSFREVASMYNVSHVTIYNMRDRIYSKYRRLNG